MTSHVPVVLAGGCGTRLWPASRTAYPKQFLSTEEGAPSLFQQALLRADALIEQADPPLIVCLAAHRFIVAAQCQAVGVQPMAILLEPEGRNTAPSVALAAAFLRQNKPQGAHLWVLPADHLLSLDADCLDAFAQAKTVAAQGSFVVFGIKPSHPDTGYGYLQVEAEEEAGGNRGHRVRRFVEKPDQAQARLYCADSAYFFNSGMFVFPLDALYQEYRRWAPDVLSACEAAIQQAEEDLDFVRIAATPFHSITPISIDYALMEQTQLSRMVPLTSLWSDLGSWDKWAAQYPRDDQANVCQGDVLALSSQGCYLKSETRVLAALGVQDLVVVDTPDALLVAHKNQTQHVRKVVEALRTQGHAAADEHPVRYRPWGQVENMAQGKGYRVQRLVVTPGHAVSLQSHRYRSEHWVLVAGEAEVVRGDTVTHYHVNESVFIPAGEKHQLRNPGEGPLVVIEVQTGDYLSEDDIERFTHLLKQTDPGCAMPAEVAED